MLLPKGKQFTNEHLLLLTESRVDGLNVLDVEQIYQFESKRRIAITNLVNAKYQENQQTFRNMTMMRRHSFHAEIKNFLIPHVMEEPVGLSHLERIEQLMNMLFDQQKLDPYFARIVSLYMHMPIFRKTVAIALIEEKIAAGHASSRREIQFTQEDRMRHCVLGYEMFQQIGDERTGQIIHQHHEQLDGSGYPQGLTNAQISRSAKIIHLAKSYTNLLSQRVGDANFGCDQVYEIIAENAQWKFDPDIVVAFVKWFKPYPIGTFLELTDGSICIVLDNAIRMC